MSRGKLARGQGVKVTTREIRAASFQGPLPPPEILEQYNQIVPGLAARIVTMAEQQSAHRQDLERTVIRKDVELARRGQLMAFAIGVVALVGGFTLVALGRDAAGVTSILGAVGALAGVFIFGKKAQRKELAQKRE